MRRVLTTFGLFDDIADVAAVGRAWSNCVWSVSTTGGCYAVKEMLNPWNDPLWREWLEEAIAFEESAIAAGVRAPRLILTPDGAALADVDDRTFRVHEWIEDAAPCSDGPVPVELARAVARDLASMHALHVAPGRTDVFPAPSTATCDGWPDLLAELHRSGSPQRQQRNARRQTSPRSAVGSHSGWWRTGGTSCRTVTLIRRICCSPAGHHGWSTGTLLRPGCRVKRRCGLPCPWPTGAGLRWSGPSWRHITMLVAPPSH